nr:mucin-2-like [Neodiprion pinetum]
MTTHTSTPSGPRQCPKCNGLVQGTKYTEHIQTCTQTNTDTPHPPQIITHPLTVTHTTRTTATHTTTHPPTKKQTPYTTTRPTPTPTPRYTPPPASPPQWAHTRFARPQTTEDRILQTFANMDRHTESTQTKQTCKQHTGPHPEIIAIIASLEPASTLYDELRAQKERYMTRQAHERTNTDETEASTSTHQPHTTHQTAPHKTQPPNTPDTDSDTDSTTFTAETVIHIETTHTGTLQTQTTDNDTDSNTDTTSLTDTVEHTQTPQPATHTTRDSKRYKKRKSIRKQKKEQNRKH